MSRRRRSRAGQLAKRVVDRLEDCLEEAARLRCAVRGRLRPVSFDSFAAQRCHCPSGMPSHLVHSEGLREGCDLVIDYGSNVQHPLRPHLLPEQLGAVAPQVRDGTVIYVRTHNLDAFVTHVLPRLRARIVLVTGDGDRSPVLAFRHLLDHPRIHHWFVQNCDLPGRHPRLTRVPIGIDNPIYTKLHKRLGFALTVALGRTPLDPSLRRNDMGDQRLLQEVAQTLPATALRPPRVLCTFHENQKLVKPDLREVPERAQAFALLRDSPDCHFVPRRLPQEACWREHGRFAFELSPRGNGLDCFRTWEALCLGTIPIVKSSTLDPLYEDEDLPVVIVSSFSEVGGENLRRWHESFAPRFDDALRRKLGCDHWLAKIRERAAEILG